MKKNLSEKNVQTITDDHIKTVDEKVSLKEKEIMTIYEPTKSCGHYHGW